MVESVCNDIFEEFKKMCPWAVKDITRWYKKGDLEIVVELRDGGAASYDYVSKTYKFVKSVDELQVKPSTEKEWRRAFAGKLYKKMRMKGMTQSELSWQTDISIGMISKYINGISTPNSYKLVKIAEVLGCDVSELIDI